MPRAECGASIPIALAVACVLAAAAVAQTKPAGPPASGEERMLQDRASDAERKAEDAANKAAARAREEDAAARRVQGLREQRRDAARRERTLADEIARLEREIERLQGAQAAARVRLSHGGERRDAVVTALVRMSGHQGAALMALPGDPLHAAQGALVSRVIEKDLRRDAGVLQASLGTLARDRQAGETAHAELLLKRRNLDRERGELDQALARSLADQERAAAERRVEIEREKKFRAEARDVNELLAAFAHELRQRAEAEARAAPKPPAQPVEKESVGRLAPQVAAVPVRPPVKAAPPAQGALIAPVSGRIARAFGQNDVQGQPSKGLLFEAAPGARVVAPYDGTVVYAGPFRGFGRILIIEHVGAYHTLIAGIGRIDCTVGQGVVTGEPVGALEPGGFASLYVEFRREGQPINPIPWFASGNNKVDG